MPIASLIVGGSPRLAGENAEHTRTLAGLDVTLPPIVVHRPTMRVIDGMHRLRAAMLRGTGNIAVRFFDGTEDQAFIFSVEANITHGLPLSLRDRTAAAEHIIGCHPQLSDRAIASSTGLSPTTIAAIRRRSTPRIGHLNTRTGRDGRVRPLDARRGRELASELIIERPNASLREIAQDVGVSPATVSDVRARLRRGEDPVVPSQRTAEPRTTGDRTANVDRNSIMQSLKTDPSLRFTQAGRWLLRFLEVCNVGEDHWERLVDNIPAHSLTTVRKMALDCSNAWRTFADQLGRRVTRELKD